MSTTRWIIETSCDHGQMETHLDHGTYDDPRCTGSSRVVVDPDNLPPEAIQRAAKVAREVFSPFNDPGGSVSRTVAQEIIRAFLSDPELGDQT